MGEKTDPIYKTSEGGVFSAVSHPTIPGHYQVMPHEATTVTRDIWKGGYRNVFDFPGQEIEETVQGIFGEDVVRKRLLQEQYYPGAYQTTKPAIFKMQGDTWTLVEKGEINLPGVRPAVTAAAVQTLEAQRAEEMARARARLGASTWKEADRLRTSGVPEIEIDALQMKWYQIEKQMVAETRPLTEDVVQEYLDKTINPQGTVKPSSTPTGKPLDPTKMTEAQMQEHLRKIEAEAKAETDAQFATGTSNYTAPESSVPKSGQPKKKVTPAGRPAEYVKKPVVDPASPHTRQPPPAAENLSPPGPTPLPSPERAKAQAERTRKVQPPPKVPKPPPIGTSAATAAETPFYRRVSGDVGSWIRKNNYYRTFEGSVAGKAFSKLTPGWKIAAGLGVTLLSLSLTRALARTLMSHEGYDPPPAYQGTYNRINGMGRSTYGIPTDFGSGVKHLQTIRRGILPTRHVDHFSMRFGR